jgi:hypothetical protein
VGTYLTRDAILAAHDLPTEEVEVPEWNGTVVVRGLTGEGRDEFESSTTVLRGNTAVRDTANIRAKLVAYCVIDHETGEPAFTQQDVAALGKLSGVALNRVWAVACRLSGMSNEDEAEAEGKSSAPDGEGSPSS